MPTQWILLILEDGQFPDESIDYAIKLAKRMDCSISILMLYDNTIGKMKKKMNGRDMLKHVVDMIIAEGIQAEGHVAIGNKASTFLKHVAFHPPLSTIVWGGNMEIDAGQMKKKEDYWFSKVKSAIQCPVVRPTIKHKANKLR